MDTPPRFSDDQKARLRDIGLKTEQVAALDTALLGIRTILTMAGTQAAVVDVRSELTRLDGALLAARKAVERMQSTTKNSALHEAQARIAVAGYEREGSLGTLGRAYDAMAEAHALVGAAIVELPKKPTRHRTADPRPIRMIDDALARGWGAAYRGASMPGLPREQVPARSVFLKVVGICYQAVGAANTDPERAIRAYMALRKKIKETRGKAHSIVVRYRRKPTKGRNASKKSDVPS
jgi:hypothetical protein